METKNYTMLIKTKWVGYISLLNNVSQIIYDITELDVNITNITVGLITFSYIRIYYKIFNIIDVTNVTVCINFIDYN